MGPTGAPGAPGARDRAVHALAVCLVVRDLAPRWGAVAAERWVAAATRYLERLARADARRGRFVAVRWPRRVTDHYARAFGRAHAVYRAAAVGHGAAHHHDAADDDHDVP
jgi:hypothetical protein